VLGWTLAALPLALAAAAPAAAFPGLSVIYAKKDAAAAIYDGRPDLTGVPDAFRQAPIVGDERWAAIWQAGKVNGRELAHLSAARMADTLRRGWENPQVGDLVAVDELVARDWTPARSRALERALDSLGRDAARVVVYVGPSIVSQVGRADLRFPLEPRLQAVLSAIRRAGAVQLEMYQGGGVPWSRAQYATYSTRWLKRFPAPDRGKLHLLMGPARVGPTHQELWARARSTPAGRALLSNGVGVYGLQSAEEGLDWLAGYRAYLADPSAPPPGGDVAVPTGGGLGLAASGERTVTVRLSRPARAVISLTPAGTDDLRVIAKVQGPMTPRRIALPADVRPGRYRVKAVAQGDGLKDVVDIPFRVRAPGARTVPDPRLRTSGGGPTAARAFPPDRRAELIRRLITLDSRFRPLLRSATAACPNRSFAAETELRLRAVDGAVLDSVAGLEHRLSSLGGAASRLEGAAQRCGEPSPAQPSPGSAAPGAPPAAPSAPVPGGPALASIALAQVVAGATIDVSAALGPRVLPNRIVPVDLAALGGPACRAAGAICLGLDRTLLEQVLRQVVDLNRLTLTLRNLFKPTSGTVLDATLPLLAAGDLGASIGVERVGERSLRLVLLGRLASLAGLPSLPQAVVGQLQVVPDARVGAGAAPIPPPSPFGPGAAPAERRLLAAVNRARAERGLPPLKRSARLARPARRHSAALARVGLLTHDSGSAPFWTRLVAAGYPAGRAMGENLARVSGCDASGAELAVQLWLASPPHRANMLSRRFRVMGAGAASDRSCTRTVFNADFGG
jgi:uncharacterized protein YkwD